MNLSMGMTLRKRKRSLMKSGYKPPEVMTVIVMNEMGSGQITYTL